MVQKARLPGDAPSKLEVMAEWFGPKLVPTIGICFGAYLFLRAEVQNAKHEREVMRADITRTAQQIERLREDFNQLRRYDVDGFSDPGMYEGARRIVDKAVAGIVARATTEFAQWAKRLKQLNPTINIPE